MTNIWKLTECRSSQNRLLSAPPGGPAIDYCDFLNPEEVLAAGFCGGQPREIPFPIAQLKLTRKDFDADCLTCRSYVLVSEWMRNAMALDSSEVRFFEVDASRSAPLPRSKNYQIIEPTVTERVSDLAKSAYSVLPLAPSVRVKLLMDGSIRNPIPPEDRAEFERLFMFLHESGRGPLDTHSTYVEAESIVMRPDVVPAHELFYDSFFHSHLLCTEAFAMRILEAGCTGVSFVDPSRLGFGINRRYRTLRGIEERMGWDAVSRVEITELVQSID